MLVKLESKVYDIRSPIGSEIATPAFREKRIRNDIVWYRLVKGCEKLHIKI